MNKIARVILSVVASAFVMTTAIDLMGWSFSGEYRNTGATFIDKLLDDVVNLPMKMMYAIFNIAVGLVESVIKLVLSLVGLSSVAEKVKLHYIDL